MFCNHVQISFLNNPYQLANETTKRQLKVCDTVRGFGLGFIN